MGFNSGFKGLNNQLDAQFFFMYEGKSGNKVPYFIVTNHLHIVMMPLYSLKVQTLVARWKPGSDTFGLSSLPQHGKKNIFMPSYSNHVMIST